MAVNTNMEIASIDSKPTSKYNDYERLSYYETIFQQIKDVAIQGGEYRAMLEQQDVGDEETTLRFTDIERLMLIGAFNELIDKLVIIGADKPKSKPSLNFHAPKVRYHEKIRKRIYDMETNAHTIHEEGIIRTYKFQRERTLMELVLKHTRDELFRSSSIDALSIFLRFEERKLGEENSIRMIHSQYLNAIKTLLDLSDESEKYTKTVLKEQTIKANQIEGELQESMFYYGIKLGYNRKWQGARIEQNSMKIDLEENALKEKLQDTRNRALTERKVHSNIMLYLKMSTSKLNKDIESWHKRYSRDIAEKDLEITNLRKRISEEGDKMKEMIRNYVRRDVEMKTYLAEKAARERAVELKLAQEKAAVKIQAWWRGTMVRWKFGQYAEKKKKKKGKEKEKKGKK